jgi:hypothetical protein
VGPEKKIQREIFAGHLSTSNQLFDLRAKRLRPGVDVLDLAGTRAPMYALLSGRKWLTSDAMLVGVDQRLDVIRECRALYGDKNARWVGGELFDLLQSDDVRVSRVRALNFDGLDGWDGKKLEGHLATLAMFVEQQRRRHGSHFLLGINVGTRSMDPSPDTYHRLLRTHFGVSAESSGYRYRSWQTPTHVGQGVAMLYTPIRFGFVGMDDDNNVYRQRLIEEQQEKGRA